MWKWTDGTNKDYIAHSGLGRPLRRDELMHWKYIRKAKVNGQWRYWYPVEEAKKRALKSKTKIGSSIKDFLGYDEKAATKAAYEATQQAYRAEDRFEDWLSDKTLTKERLQTRKELAEARNDAWADYWKAHEDYAKTPIAKLEKASNDFRDWVNDGAQAVSKFFKKLFGGK